MLGMISAAGGGTLFEEGGEAGQSGGSGEGVADGFDQKFCSKRFLENGWIIEVAGGLASAIVASCGRKNHGDGWSQLLNEFRAGAGREADVHEQKGNAVRMLSPESPSVFRRCGVQNIEPTLL